MSDHAQIQRTIQLILQLGTTGKSRQEIAAHLDVHERTVYRYINTLLDIGFVVKKENGYFRIPKTSPLYKDLTRMVIFSPEESAILLQAIHAISDSNILKNTLIRKLNTLYSHQEIAQIISRDALSKNVSKLSGAITGERQVILKNYRSANGHSVIDRLVEPYAFTTNFVSVWCYDLNKHDNRIFKTARIETVEVLNMRWQHKKQHKEGPVDVFGMSSKQTRHITLKLSLRAVSLLNEEYPQSEEKIMQINENQYLFEDNVYGYKAAGRFVLGLIDEIEVIGDAGFKDYLNEKIKHHKF
jgi:predicted DNA-binding transcriptional regulator YafY